MVVENTLQKIYLYCFFGMLIENDRAEKIILSKIRQEEGKFFHNISKTIL